jgi:hypothetical protein
VPVFEEKVDIVKITIDVIYSLLGKVRAGRRRIRRVVEDRLLQNPFCPKLATCIPRGQ